MAMERTLGTKKKDKIRYQYDEHYFLCDPLEFIQEFFPDEEKWQLLEHPLTLEEFEDLPFVRFVNVFSCSLKLTSTVTHGLHAD